MKFSARVNVYILKLIIQKTKLDKSKVRLIYGISNLAGLQNPISAEKVKYLVVLGV